MSDEADRDLRQRFQVLRERDEAESPAFRSLWRAAAPAPSRRPWLAGAAAAATCAALLLLAVLARPGADIESPRPALALEHAPLDFLLKPVRPCASLPMPAAAGRGFLE